LFCQSATDWPVRIRTTTTSLAALQSSRTAALARGCGHPVSRSARAGYTSRSSGAGNPPGPPPEPDPLCHPLLNRWGPELRPGHQSQPGHRREDQTEHRSVSEPDHTRAKAGRLIIGNNTDHHASTRSPFASATRITVTVSSMSDSVLRELLAQCHFDVPDIAKPSVRSCRS